MLLPSFKSVIDFTLLSYIHFMYEIELPFIAGLNEFDQIPLLSKVMRRCGGYFVDKKHRHKELYNIVLEELLGEMMKKRLVMTYHLERHRERFGKINNPGEFIFENLMNAYLRNIDDIDDLILVPVTFNYDKIYEGEAFPYELLGEERPKETFYRVLKHTLMSSERQGKVVIKYCKPISLKQMLMEYSQ
mmetsp:Transcript_29854/g.29017  ORF Transcript_29854/g.29017 Transcript_29854/m.29017 type:complete len:189 (+) Transcript_29854:1251-1817(+)